MVFFNLRDGAVPLQGSTMLHNYTVLLYRPDQKDHILALEWAFLEVAVGESKMRGIQLVPVCSHIIGYLYMTHTGSLKDPNFTELSGIFYLGNPFTIP